MRSFKEYIIDLFNLDKTRQPYSFSQISGMFAIVLFLFPVIFNVFGFLVVPVAYMIEFVFEPRDAAAVFYSKLVILVLKLVFGSAAGIWICKMVWPKRKTVQEKELKQ